MIERGAKLRVKRLAELLDLGRSNVSCVPRPLSERDLALRRRIDELHLQWPFYVLRKLTIELTNERFTVGRRNVRTLMQRIWIEASYRKPRTSLAGRGACVHPYLLGGLAIERPNQVWSADITYLPMAHGFQYPGGEPGRREQEALRRLGAPEIFNADQGARFTSDEWLGTLKAAGVQISMDGKGRWIGNVFIERLYRTSGDTESGMSVIEGKSPELLPASPADLL